eukprot:UN29076
MEPATLQRECRDLHQKEDEWGLLWNGMTVPFVNMTIRQVLWYQGENNMKECCDPAGGDEYCDNLKGTYKYFNNAWSRGSEFITNKKGEFHKVEFGGYTGCGHVLTRRGYSCGIKTLVNSWREWWGNDELPFAMVTLAPGTDEGHAPNLSAMRWAQTANHGVVPNPDLKNVILTQAYDLRDPWGTNTCAQDHDYHGDDKTLGCQGWDVPYNIWSTKPLYGPI